MQVQKDREQMGYLLYRINDEKRKAEFNRGIKQGNYNVLKEKLKDPIQRKMLEMEIATELHKAIQKTKLKNMDDKEPVSQMLDKFINISEEKQTKPTVIKSTAEPKKSTKCDTQ